VTNAKRYHANLLRTFHPNPDTNVSRLGIALNVEGITPSVEEDNDTGMCTLRLDDAHTISLALLLGEEEYGRLLPLKSTTSLNEAIYLLTDEQVGTLADAIEATWPPAN
jgi:hypothetical protein